MKYKLILIAMFSLIATEPSTSCSALAEILRSNHKITEDFSIEERKDLLADARKLDEKIMTLEESCFAQEKSKDEWFQKRYKEESKSRILDRFFLFGTIGLLTFYIIYKGLSDCKKEVDTI
ncbi:hypothetical protein [Alphaproteobacteria bacterium endosymbiont of Tiliacea citrago]|uniref:hypothetical protein n=1 Tax=Alphaproteobacteria bacterium endosymbiont of Tiliacea citrago TaxID=3077944 RepID=UPI00313BDF9C